LERLREKEMYRGERDAQRKREKGEMKIERGGGGEWGEREREIWRERQRERERERERERDREREIERERDLPELIGEREVNLVEHYDAPDTRLDLVDQVLSVRE
jgi:hypothetical protein